jgi:di/tricarboxylate transporter
LIRTSASSDPVKESKHRRPWRRSIAVACCAGALILLAAVGAFWLFRSSPEMQLIWRRDAANIAAVLIFTATYAVMAIGKLPGSHMDRAGAALLGASLMVTTGLLSLDDAYRAVDFDTIALLLGMMIIVANIRLSGFFQLVNNWS